MKKCISFLTTAVLTASLTMPINTVFASGSAITKAYGWNESMHIEWNNDSNAENAVVSYKLDGSNTYTPIDNELVRQGANGGVADIVGIKSGTYDISVKTGDNEVLSVEDIQVTENDRSGYSHFGKTDGIGGYNNDGTPKSDAVIVYVDNSNKNTVTAQSRKGLANIVKNLGKSGTPLIIRVIGKVDTQTRDSDGSKKTDINNGVVAIDGLTDYAQSNDSYFNMMDVSDSSNITIEGIGEDAVIEKWGFTFSKCSSIEIRNLKFTKYPEDACSFQGNTSKPTSYKNFWVHNNYFEKGENKYDLTSEQDKGDGDGSTDFKGCSNITYSYNVFENCHKTSLHGGSDSNLQYNSTWHHNYFINCGARLPLTRQVNLHSYNNYFYNCNTGIDARASAWVFAENNYFDFDAKSDDVKCIVTRTGSNGYPVVKLYGNEFANSAKYVDNTNTIVEAKSRDEVIDASKLISSSNANKNLYPNFDTNATYFYYDTANKKSDVTYLSSALGAKDDCARCSGTMAEGKTLGVYYTGSDVEPDTQTTTQAQNQNETSTTEATTTETTTEATTVNVVDGDVYTLLPTDFNEGTYNSSVVDNSGYFTLNGGEKGVTVSSSNINLGGSGTIETGRNIAVNAVKGATIAVEFYSSEGRVLVLANSEGQQLTSGTTTGGEKDSYSYTVTEDGTYYFYSTNSGIKITKITLTLPKNSTVLKGDVNKDGAIDSKDASVILQMSSGIVEKDVESADVNADGSVDAKDAAIILAYASGNIKEI